MHSLSSWLFLFPWSIGGVECCHRLRSLAYEPRAAVESGKPVALVGERVRPVRIDAARTLSV